MASTEIAARTYEKVTTEVYPGSEWPRLATVWEDLSRKAQRTLGFLGPLWIASWMQAFGEQIDVSILLFRDEEKAAGICLLAKTKAHRGPVPFRRLSLNTAGEEAHESTYIEFNKLLCLPGSERAVAKELARHAMAARWDEFAVDGIEPGPCYDAIREAFAGLECEELRHPSYYVDLAALRAEGGTYESLMGAGRRKHLRQYAKAYSQLGPLRFEAAKNAEERSRMLAELGELSRQRWSGRTEYVVFESPRFVRFHQQLIQGSAEGAGVDFLRLSAGDRTIGLIYNLVHGRNAYFYQCGYDYSIDRRLSPGTLTLAHAIQYCLDRGFETYEFMSGAAPYKQQLSSGAREMIWTVFRRPTLRNHLAAAARKSMSLLRRRNQTGNTTS